MSADQKGNWCVFYRKMSEEPYVWHTIKTWRSDGVLVSAKTYNEVYKFEKFKEAFDFVKNLITDGPNPKYYASVRRVQKARGDAFYLEGIV